MWLINVNTLQLEYFISDESAPFFSILSHTWGNEEISFQEFNEWPCSDATRQKSGYRKIEKFCALVGAMHNGYEYFGKSSPITYAWVDTCCIDKKSSAELSEAINFMYRYYSNAVVCFAFLDDVSHMGRGGDDRKSFKDSRWFTRGWTLQEFLAPSHLAFFDCEWMLIGTKRTLWQQLSEATNIDADHLYNPETGPSIATRMSWASNRSTTRSEDIAYCLMGVFRINLPLLYGEGSRAFRRLQEELVRKSYDESIFAWTCNADLKDITSGILAPSPAAFRHIVKIQGGVSHYIRQSPFMITNHGLQMDVACQQFNHVARLPLTCRVRTEDGTKKHIKIHLKNTTQNLFVRVEADEIHYWSEEDDEFGSRFDKRIYIKLWEDTFADSALRYLKNEQKLQQEA